MNPYKFILQPTRDLFRNFSRDSIENFHMNSENSSGIFPKIVAPLLSVMQAGILPDIPAEIYTEIRLGFSLDFPPCLTTEIHPTFTQTINLIIPPRIFQKYFPWRNLYKNYFRNKSRVFFFFADTYLCVFFLDCSSGFLFRNSSHRFYLEFSYKSLFFLRNSTKSSPRSFFSKFLQYTS